MTARPAGESQGRGRGKGRDTQKPGGSGAVRRCELRRGNPRNRFRRRQTAALLDGAYVSDLISQRRKAAFHEAGHAVVAVYQGNFILERGVSIDGKGLGVTHIGMGHTSLSPLSWYHGCRYMTRSLLLDLAFSQAGWLAERQFAGATPYGDDYLQWLVSEPRYERAVPVTNSRNI